MALDLQTQLAPHRVDDAVRLILHALEEGRGRLAIVSLKVSHGFSQ